MVSAQERNTSGVKVAKRLDNPPCMYKLKPVVVGKYRKPRSFKNVNMEALPVHAMQSKNAWMDTDIWFHLQFVPAVKQHLQSLGKAILLVDNCAAHSLEDILCSEEIHTICLT